MTAAFKVDVHLALLTGHPPLIQREELDLPLVSTYALWNAYGLDLFPTRFRTQPDERAGYHMCDLLTFGRNSQVQPRGDSIVLLEDVEVGLLGVVHNTWQHARWSRKWVDASASACDAEHQKPLHQLLGFWKERLNNVRGAEGALLEEYVRSYAGEEEEDKAEDRHAILDRLRAYVLHAVLLYHFVTVHSYADVETLRQVLMADAAAEECPRGRDREAQMRQWANSPDGRRAVLHALYILKAYRDDAQLAALRNLEVDPIAHLALTAAALVTWMWMMAGAQACTYAQNIAGLDLGQYAPESPQIADWVQSSGVVSLDGTPLCRSNAADWMRVFAGALTGAGRRWDAIVGVWESLETKSRFS